MNTHFAVVYFGGDFDNDHPDESLRGTEPSLTLVGAGHEAFCWDALAKWTAVHPLTRDQTAEVVSREAAYREQAEALIADLRARLSHAEARLAEKGGAA